MNRRESQASWARKSSSQFLLPEIIPESLINADLCEVSLLKLLIARSTEVGSRNLVWAGTNETPSGAYVDSCQVHEYVPPSPFRQKAKTPALIRSTTGRPTLSCPQRVRPLARGSGMK